MSPDLLKKKVVFQLVQFKPVKEQVDVFPYLKTRRLCVLSHYLGLPLI